MKNIVVVIVYNRFENLKRWVECWKQCDTKECELRIIHNYASEIDKQSYKKYCDLENITYIPRINRGLDIGAFQDVCKERLQGFDNNWLNMLWFTDDCIPMRKDFVKSYIAPMNNSTVGVSCMEISNEFKRHIRTTGFSIRKELSKKLTFRIDPIVTMQQCWDFEHGRHGNPDTLLNQVIHLKYKAIMIGELKNSPVWDTGHRKNLNRWEEHYNEFPQKTKEIKKVTFIATIYNSYPEIIGGLINQTYKNWELLLIHDGKNDTGLSKLIDTIADSRIRFIETEERKKQWGHPIRKWALENIDVLSPNTDYIVITNADNNHFPSYIEYMIGGFITNNIVATYCSQMVHSYLKWAVINCKLQLGYVDCGGVMVKKEIAKEVGWEDMSHPSDWTYFNNIITKYGVNKWKKVEGCLISHN